MEKWLQYVWKWIVDNKNWLFSGIALVILGGLSRYVVRVFNAWRTRKKRIDTSPFKIIPPNSNVAKKVLGGMDDDPLADRNIPYQHRVKGRNIRREIEEKLEQQRWVLITGRTGLGKTREAVHVAESLNKEGWTVLYLTREQWLDAPARLPNDIPERKLLFLLDDLNRKCYAGQMEQSPRSGEVLQPLTESFQKRLQRVLEAYEILCGKGEIRVIATARDEMVREFPAEPSEWEKLEFGKYQALWHQFALYDLTQPQDAAAESLLIQTFPQAKILANPEDFTSIAQRNDCTFANLVENLRTARNTGEPLNRETFRETLKGTWEKRYQDAVTKKKFAKYIYDAVDLARSVRLGLSLWNVISIANILAGDDWRRFNFFKNNITLRNLIRTENILSPRDGQVEAKGYKVDVQKYLPQLYIQIMEENYPAKNQFQRFIIYMNLLPISGFLPEKRLSKWLKILANFSLLSSYYSINTQLNEIGRAYQQLGFYEHALLLHKRSLELVKWPIFGWITEKYDRNTQAFSWVDLGNAYASLGRADEAIKAYNNAIEFAPNVVRPWNAIANYYRNQGRMEEAITACKKATEIKPKSSIPWNILGNIYSDLDQTDEAISAYQKAIELEPNSLVNLDNLGNVYMELRRFDDAIRIYLEMIALDKQCFAYVSLATCYRKLGNTEEADKHLQIARSLMEKTLIFVRARIEAVSGNIENTLIYAREALNSGGISKAWIRRDPNFDFIRADPRFKELVEEEGEKNRMVGS